MKNEQEERGYLDYESLCICLDIGPGSFDTLNISILKKRIFSMTILVLCFDFYLGYLRFG